LANIKNIPLSSPPWSPPERCGRTLHHRKYRLPTRDRWGLGLCGCGVWVWVCDTTHKGVWHRSVLRLQGTLLQKDTKLSQPDAEATWSRGQVFYTRAQPDTLRHHEPSSAHSTHTHMLNPCPAPPPPITALRWFLSSTLA
jgi:hypothetical protein